MSYELKEYLNAINFTKKNVMESEDKMWIKKYWITHLNLTCDINSVKQATRLTSWSATKADLY